MFEGQGSIFPLLMMTLLFQDEKALSCLLSYKQRHFCVIDRVHYPEMVVFNSIKSKTFLPGQATNSLEEVQHQGGPHQLNNIASFATSEAAALKSVMLLGIKLSYCLR